MAIEITHRSDDSAGHYDLLIDGSSVGELDHRDVDGVRTFTHTGVRPAHEGRGLAAHLVRRGLDDARADGMRVSPAQLRRHLPATPPRGPGPAGLGVPGGSCVRTGERPMG